jgi:hypothetical protein
MLQSIVDRHRRRAARVVASSSNKSQPLPSLVKFNAVAAISIFRVRMMRLTANQCGHAMLRD